MTRPQEKLEPIDTALASLHQAMDALEDLLAQGEETVRVDGITHELRELVERLHSLRDDMAADGERGE